MKNSIVRKIRTHTLAIGIVTAVVFSFLIIAGLIITRQTMVSAGNTLGVSAAEDARRIVIEQTENELSRLVQSKAAICDEKLSSTAEYIRIISSVATNIKSNPNKYSRRDISFPDTSNTEGKITVMMQIPPDTRRADLENEIGLIANIQDTLIAIQSVYLSAATTTVSTEFGVTINSDPDSAQKTPYFEPRTRPWYINAKQANDLIWTDVFEDYLGRGLAVSCAMPFYDAYGNIAGVTSMGTFLTTLRHDIVGTKIGETGYAFMIDAKGDMIISDNIIRGNILENGAFPRGTALKMINRENGIERVIMDGKEKFIAYQGLITVPWSLAVIIDADEVIAPAHQLEDNIISLKQITLDTFAKDIQMIGITAAFILIFIIIAVMYFSRRLADDITSPIQKLTDDAALIGSGDLEHVLTIKTGDELELLADSFNKMIKGIKEITAEKERLEIANKADKEYQEKLHNIALKEQEANQLKSRFLATMSHEIRTPMNVIIGITEIQLQSEDNPPDTQDAFEKIHESGNLLLNIINDILDFSKIVEGKMEITPFQYDVPSLINDTAQLNYLRCESKPIEFIVSVDPDTPLELTGDGLRIKQILNNLLSNAFKYTEDGQIELSVYSEPSAGDGPSDEIIIVFRIRDTGQGISQEHTEKLFEDYMRFNQDINRAVTGTGLGLSITKRLLSLMNGEIYVESEPGKGSVFTVKLPQKRAGDAVCGKENAQRLREFDYYSKAIAKKSQFTREYMPYGSVLVVDDVKSNLFVARGLLLPYGLQIETIDSGYEAIEKVKSGGVYDIIFLDHMMPVMDGIETARIIRDMGYVNPIIALTANALVGQEEMFIQNGFDGFIPKPIDSRKLNTVLNEYIRDKKPTEVVEAARKEQSKKNVKRNANPELTKYFLIDAQKAIDKLEKIYSKIDTLDEADKKSYRISIHSMKSALANIGQKKLSETAGSLEKAVIENQFALMSEITPVFLQDLKSLILKLDTAEDNDNAQAGGDALLLKEKLYEAKQACREVNKKAAKEAIKAIKQNSNLQPDISKAIDEISVCLLHSEFEAAGNLIEKIVKDFNL